MDDLDRGCCDIAKELCKNCPFAKQRYWMAYNHYMQEWKAKHKRGQLRLDIWFHSQTIGLAIGPGLMYAAFRKREGDDREWIIARVTRDGMEQIGVAVNGGEAWERVRKAWATDDRRRERTGS